MKGILSPVAVCSGRHHPARHPRVLEAYGRCSGLTLDIKSAADVRIGMQMFGVETEFGIDIREQGIDLWLVVLRIPMMLVSEVLSALI